MIPFELAAEGAAYAAASPEGKLAATAAEKGLEEVFSAFGFASKSTEAPITPLADPSALSGVVGEILPKAKEIQARQLAGLDTKRMTRALGGSLTSALNKAGIGRRLTTVELDGVDPRLGGVYTFGGAKGGELGVNASSLRDPEFGVDKFLGVIMHEATHFEQDGLMLRTGDLSPLPDIRRAETLKSSFAGADALSNAIRRANGNIDSFWGAQQKLYEEPFWSPERLLHFERQRDFGSLKALFGKPSIPAELKFWARAQEGIDERNIQPLLDATNARERKLLNVSDAAVDKYNDQFHEREALLVQELAARAARSQL